MHGSVTIAYPECDKIQTNVLNVISNIYYPQSIINSTTPTVHEVYTLAAHENEKATACL